jgi:hypothetical protein
MIAVAKRSTKPDPETLVPRRPRRSPNAGRASPVRPAESSGLYYSPEGAARVGRVGRSRRCSASPSCAHEMVFTGSGISGDGAERSRCIPRVSSPLHSGLCCRKSWGRCLRYRLPALAGLLLPYEGRPVFLHDIVTPPAPAAGGAITTRNERFVSKAALNQRKWISGAQVADDGLE